MKKETQFSIILILTIILTRIITLYVVDPNIIIGKLELHHIYYGIILLAFTLIFLHKKKTFMPFIIISIGLIIDELEYALRGFGNQEIYTATLPSAILLTIVAISIISYKGRKNEKTN